MRRKHAEGMRSTTDSSSRRLRSESASALIASGRPRILHFIDSCGIYGAEKVILHLAQEAQKDATFVPVVGCIVQKAGDSVALAEEARRLGIEAVTVVINNTWFPLHLLRVALQLKNSGIDLIQSHGYKPAVFGYFIAKLIGVPVLATCHLWFTGSNPPLRYRVMTWLERKLYRYYPRIVCVSPHIKQILARSGIAPSKVVVIDNGVEVGDVQPRADELVRSRARRALSLRDDVFVALNVGRLSEQKGQRCIIALAELMRARAEPAVFLIAGDGEERAALEDTIAERSLGDCVRLLGFRDDIGDLLIAADAFFMPSLDEGMPVSLLEAMAAGLPVVATPVGAIPKVVANGEYGLLVETGDIEGMHQALMTVWREPAATARLAEKALDKVRRDYSSAAMYRNYRAIYNSLLTKGRHPSDKND